MDYLRLDANNPQIRNRELRKFAHEVDIRRRQDNVIEVENEQPVNNNTMDYMDSIESRTGSVANLGRLIHQEIGPTSKFTRPRSCKLRCWSYFLMYQST